MKGMLLFNVREGFDNAAIEKDLITSLVKIDYFADSMGKSVLLILVHAGLIQEWNIFLDSVFRKVVLYCLETNQLDRLQCVEIDLREITPISLSAVRESISSAAWYSFAFSPYNKKTGQLRTIFKTKENDEALNDEMKIHVEIRNIIQHHRGIIREDHLKRIGKDSIKILNEKGELTPHSVGVEIKLSLPAIKKLNQTINEYSKQFEVLS